MTTMVLVAVFAASLDDTCGQELHAAVGTAVRLVARHLRMHGADVHGLFRRLGEQLHAALRAAARLIAHDLRVHRADVNDRHALRHRHVHLGGERERLVGWRPEERLDLLA